jgi:uncharacterized membrane protein YfcA
MKGCSPNARTQTLCSAMTPFQFDLLTFGVSVLAGIFGSLLGLGGGIIVIPALTLLFGIDIRYAIGASVVSVIATSSGAAAVYVRERIANLRVAMLLEIATTSGALTGAYLAGQIDPRWLYIIFGVIMGFSSIMMLRKKHDVARPVDPGGARSWADLLRLHSSYYDHSTGQEVAYRVRWPGLGLCLMYVAGVVSGLLGIGSGALKVPAMDLAMQLPIKASTATSNFMIGVTAAASAGVYFMRGDIDPFVAAPVATGVLLGAMLGSHLLGRLQNSTIRLVFVAVLVLVSLQMLWKGVRG